MPIWGTCPLCERNGIAIFSRGYCGPCDNGFEAVIAQLVHRFETYLARHAAFDAWLAEHGKE